MGPPSELLEEAIQEAEGRIGRQMIRIITPAFNLLPGGDPANDPQVVLDLCKEKLHATFCLPHQMVTDALLDLRSGEIRELDLYTSMIRDCQNALDPTGRFALLKLLTGALRVGVSARLAKTALASVGGVDVAEIEEAWHAVSPPYADLFAWLEGRGARPDPGRAAVFRPLMLSHPIEEREFAALEPALFAAEWKWDGIRVQVASTEAETRLYSRSGDDISAAFPDVIHAFRGVHGVADGGITVIAVPTGDGEVATLIASGSGDEVGGRD